MKLLPDLNFRENHYPPYGLKIAGISSVKLGDVAEGSIKNTYLYNDKELFDDGGLNWYDYGYRSYDPQIGRFPQLDPLTWKYPQLTPYQYASDDPITNIDLDGLEGVSPLVDVGDAVVTAKSFLAPAVIKGLSKAQLAAKATAKFAALQKTITAFKITLNIADAIRSGTSTLPLQKLTGPSFPNQATVGPDRFPIRSKAEQASIKAIYDNAEKQEDRDRNEKADGYKLPIMGNLFTAINRGYHGDFGGAVKPGLYFGIDVATIPAGGEGTTLTKVGRWMSETEYLAMKNGERVIEGAGGQTFVTEGGPHLYTGASPGSIYVEFEVPTNSLLKGGKEGWFKMIGPNAEKSQLFMLQKQGGELLPKYNNLSKALKVK